MELFSTFVTTEDPNQNGFAVQNPNVLSDLVKGKDATTPFRVTDETARFIGATKWKSKDCQYDPWTAKYNCGIKSWKDANFKPVPGYIPGEKIETGDYINGFTAGKIRYKADKIGGCPAALGCRPERFGGPNCKGGNIGNKHYCSIPFNGAATGLTFGTHPYLKLREKAARGIDDQCYEDGKKGLVSNPLNFVGRSNGKVFGSRCCDMWDYGQVAEPDRRHWGVVQAHQDKLRCGRSDCLYAFAFMISAYVS